MVKIAVLSVLFLFSNLAYCEDLNRFEKIINATCQVNRGSGVVFAESETAYWIISAGHCVSDNSGIAHPKHEVKFFHSGKASNLIKAELIWHRHVFNTVEDLALLKVLKVDLGDYPPPNIIPIAPKDTEITSGQYVISCGCPGMIWAAAWKGYIDYTDEVTFKFMPKPEPGRSGSGIFTDDGKHLIGIVIWVDGTTVPLWKIYELTQWK